MENLYVIKLGGNIVDQPTLLSACLASIAALKAPFILIHGGGKLATEMAANLGVQQKMITGRRITDAATLKIVTMVYAGYINKNIVATLQSYGVNAMGLSGVDGNLIQAHQRNNASIDFGFVGDIHKVNSVQFQNLLTQNIKVVVAPITHDGKGQLLNTNADSVAQSIATAMTNLYQVHLIYAFEQEGVLMDIQNTTTVIPKIDRACYERLKEEKIIFDGMVPKMDNAYLAIDGGVRSVIIGNAQCLPQLINGTAGTTIIL